MTGTRLPRFGRDLAHSIGSSGAGFAITLVTTPLMTRLFSAEAYGINGMVMMATTFLSAFGLFGLPVALAGEQAGPEQTRLVHASVQLAVILCVVCTLGMGMVLLFIQVDPPGLTGAVVCLFPLMVLANTAQRIADSLVTARGVFPPLAVGRIANAATARGLTLGLGWLVHAGAAVMLLGQVIGNLVHLAVVTQGGRLGPVWRSLRWRPNFAFLCAAVRDYRDFALHSNIAGVLPMVTGLSLQVLIGIQLNAAATGHYVLAQSIISLPVSLIAMASAPVVFHRLMRVAAETPTRLIPFALQIMLGYVLLGVVLMLPIALFGPDIFAFVFGEPWRTAGVAAAMLCFPQILAFSQTVLMSTFRVTRRIKAWLAFELAGTLVVLGGFALLPPASDLAGTAAHLALLGFGYQILMNAGCIWAARSLEERKP